MVVRAEAGSPPSAASMRKYQVFLSFRGKDTRKSFTDHLYAALLQAQIHTFKDEHALERGKNIGKELQKAIKECEIALVVFSRNYAESKWCLDELVGMMEKPGLLVIPVFYDLKPSDVRSQTGSVGEAFSKHEECESKEKVDSWRAALRQVADLGGMVLQNEADGYESKFIQEIIQNVKTNLDMEPIQLVKDFVDWDCQHLVGCLGYPERSHCIVLSYFKFFHQTSFIRSQRHCSRLGIKNGSWCSRNNIIHAFLGAWLFKVMGVPVLIGLSFRRTVVPLILILQFFRLHFGFWFVRILLV